MSSSVFGNFVLRSEPLGDIQAIHFYTADDLSKAIKEMQTLFILLPRLSEKVKSHHPTLPNSIKGLECQLTFPSTSDERTGVSSLQLHTLDIEGIHLRMSHIKLYSSDRDSAFFSGFASSEVLQTTGIASASDHAKMLIEAYAQIQQGNYEISLTVYPFHPGYRIERLSIPGVSIMPFAQYSADRAVYHMPGHYAEQIDAQRQKEQQHSPLSKLVPRREFGQAALRPIKRRSKKSPPNQKVLPLS